MLNADRIAAVEQGHIIAIGTREERLKSCLLYAYLAAFQFDVQMD